MVRGGWGRVGDWNTSGVPTTGGGGAWLTGSLVPQRGKTPLHSAADYGSEAVVGALLKAGVDKEAKDEVKGGRVQGESGALRCGL